MRGPNMERQISVYDSKTRSQRFVTISKRSPRLQNIRMKHEDLQDEEHYYPMIVGKGGEVKILDTAFRKDERRPLRTTTGSYYANTVTAKYDMSKTTDRKRSDTEQRYVVQPGPSLARDYCRLSKNDFKSSTNSSPSNCKERDRILELNHANRLARTRENISRVPRSRSDAHLYVNPYDRDEYCRIAGESKKTRELRQSSLPTTKVLGLQELQQISALNNVNKTQSSRGLKSHSEFDKLSRQTSVDTNNEIKTFPKKTEYQPRERILYSTSESDDSDIECCGNDSDEFIDYCSCMCCVKGILYHYSKDTDNEGRLADEPCSCSGAGCLLRWGCLGVMSIFLPCLLCYLPAKGCAKLASKCKRRKKNSKSKKVSYRPTKD